MDSQFLLLANLSSRLESVMKISIKLLEITFPSARSNSCFPNKKQIGEVSCLNERSQALNH